MEQSEFVRTKSGAGSHLLMTEKHYAIFGNATTDDLVVIGEHRLKNCATSLYQGVSRVDIPLIDLSTLHQNVSELSRTTALSLFTIYLDDVKRIKASIRKLDATHVRIWSNDRGVTVTVFDCRDFDFDRRIGRKNSLKLNYLDVETISDEVFSVTVNTQSFKKIPTGDWNVRVGQNGVTEIKPFTGNESFLIRDQQLVEPVSLFDSISVGQKISFLFHPN